MKGKIRTETQVFLTLKTHALHGYLNMIPSHAAPSPPILHLAVTINNKGHHLWSACWARIRKPWLRDVHLTHIPNKYVVEPGFKSSPLDSRAELSVPPGEPRAVARLWSQDHTANNNGGQFQKWLSRSHRLILQVSPSNFLLLISQKNRIKTPEAQFPYSQQVRNNPKGVRGSQWQSQWPQVSDNWHRGEENENLESQTQNYMVHQWST